MNKFSPHKYQNYWGRLRQFQTPFSIVVEDTLVLGASALSVLLIILQSARERRPHPSEQSVEVTIRHKLLQQRSGLSKNIISAALEKLEDSGFIKRISGARKKHQRFAANTYLVCNPQTGEPLRATGGNFLHRNGVHYLNIPKCIVMESSADWSIARMTGSQVRLYVAFCWLANKTRGHRFDISAVSARKLAAMKKPTFEKALKALEGWHLVSVERTADALSVELCDPYTGESLGQEIVEALDDPANYYVTAEKGRAKRINLNYVNPQEAELLVRSCLSADAPLVPQRNGDLKICCPFHPDTNPSCSFSPARYCFQCFGCKRKGSLIDLIAGLKGVGRGSAIEYMATFLGKHVEYHDPDRNALDIYSYYNKTGKLIKQVLRYPDKVFKQRRPGGSGAWIWKLDGVEPLLYNLFFLQHVGTVAVCEGEKDCDTLNAAKLVDCYGGEIVATTSGGADTWVDKFADELIGKRVIIFPDTDEGGAKYAAAVIASLEARAIEYRVVSFADVDAKDVTEFLVDLGHPVAELVERIGSDWVTTEELRQAERADLPVSV